MSCLSKANTSNFIELLKPSEAVTIEQMQAIFPILCGEPETRNFTRITEDGDTRITEDSDIRITDDGR